ncbi:S-adenosyl-L-methionine-dependent methyltransferase [Penicillium samsonianum]|uniref:S-adenosyl-L-methionine-dependent methyltransferase n=1 Tax=Penicillium samsonianum TaxID=1882272 RepID=UPI0025477B1C|nr:S-adenosyl-L-methionine-dependent methyltransferase [Penicillium samsonianum]KAJ6118418.1 S-adenosyl-L-methionine-dependent methyltransferase [Penicillium samsonianum]
MSQTTLNFSRHSEAAARIWLLDLAEVLPPTAELHGFDISSAHFPTKRELPANIFLDTLDALGSVPEHLHGQYDVVHCRGLMLYIQEGDPSRLIANLRSMLSMAPLYDAKTLKLTIAEEPGGFLQWEELDVVNMYMRTDDASKRYPNCAKYLEHGKIWLESVGIRGRQVI